MTMEVLDLLLVEDNPGDVRLIEEMLTEAGRNSTATDDPGIQRYDLRHTDTLEKGLQQLSQDAIDVVLLDLGLPDSSGIATLETVRERSRETPIVVLTGLSDESVGDRTVQQGAQEYLVKDELTSPLLRRSIRHAIERKNFERTQAALHTAARDLIQAESGSEVGDLVVETAADILELRTIGVYLFDDSENVLQPVAYTDYVEEIFGEVPSFHPNDTAITWRAFIEGETITHDDVRESEYVHRRDTPLRSGIWIPLGDHGTIAILSEEVDGLDQQTHRLADHLAATAEAALERIEREASLQERERELEQQNRQLRDLDRLNRMIREIDQVLVQATTREEIERAVCERLTREDRFAFAWIGDVVDNGALTPRAWAGDDQGYLDAISLATDAENPPPSITAISTGTIEFVSNVATNLREEPWRKAALARDLQSAISIPITHNELSYGVLTVFSTEPDRFDTRSREIAAEFGETVANAMNSLETRKALLTDTVVELELAIADSNETLSRLARGADCRIEYGGIVPQSGDTARLFITASGSATEEIEAVAEEMPSIQHLERISETASDDESGEVRFEMVVEGTTIPSTLVECGALARSIRATGSELRVEVELPNTTDVRTFVTRLEETYSGVELIARRDKERGDRSRQAFETVLTSELTDRQLETLRTAYYSGYFAWPRERTGEEVAESLDITQPTFNGHLRAAERKLCTMLFDGPSSPPE